MKETNGVTGSVEPRSGMPPIASSQGRRLISLAAAFFSLCEGAWLMLAGLTKETPSPPVPFRHRRFPLNLGRDSGQTIRIRDCWTASRVPANADLQ